MVQVICIVEWYVSFSVDVFMTRVVYLLEAVCGPRPIAGVGLRGTVVSPAVFALNASACSERCAESRRCDAFTLTPEGVCTLYGQDYTRYPRPACDSSICANKPPSKNYYSFVFFFTLLFFARFFQLED